MQQLAERQAGHSAGIRPAGLLRRLSAGLEKLADQRVGEPCLEIVVAPAGLDDQLPVDAHGCEGPIAWRLPRHAGRRTSAIAYV